jgi:hypothetical protein
MISLEMEQQHQRQHQHQQDPNDDYLSSIRPKRRRTISKKEVVVRYLCLSSLAVILTVSCPGDTILYHRDDDDDSLNHGRYCLVQLLVVYALLLCSFFQLQGSNPGYLKKKMMMQQSPLLPPEQDEEMQPTEESFLGENPTGQEEEENALLLTTTSDDDEDGDYFGDATSFARLTQQQQQQQQVPQCYRKPCPVCHLSKPPLRSHHCKDCQQCVATFDHHCHFLGTCIGERNHFRFYIFVTMNAIGFYTCLAIVNSSPLLGVGLTTLLFPNNHNNNNNHNTNDEGTMFWLEVTMVLLIKLYLYTLAAAAFSLWGIHSFLIVTNSTTFEQMMGSKLEYLKDTKSRCDSPFSQGSWCQNVWLRWQLDDGCCWMLLLLTRRTHNPNDVPFHHWTPRS